MTKQLAVCPVCSGGMYVTEQECARCQTRIHSRFESCRFCRLSPEHLGFIELFLRSEGNLSRVEKEMGLSYPTVRNRLLAALGALGLLGSAAEEMPADPAGALPSESIAERRRALLDSLARGDVSAEDVARLLRDLA